MSRTDVYSGQFARALAHSPITLKVSTGQILHFKPIAPETCRLRCLGKTGQFAALLGVPRGAPFETGGITLRCRAK